MVGLGREVPLFQGKLGWWNISIWTNIYLYKWVWLEIVRKEMMQKAALFDLLDFRDLFWQPDPEQQTRMRTRKISYLVINGVKKNNKWTKINELARVISPYLKELFYPIYNWWQGAPCVETWTFVDMSQYFGSWTHWNHLKSMTFYR